ncbi:MAG: hypothetical protein ACK5MN_10480 [Lachnospiraceae bacterium]
MYIKIFCIICLAWIFIGMNEVAVPAAEVIYMDYKGFLAGESIQMALGDTTVENSTILGYGGYQWYVVGLGDEGINASDDAAALTLFSSEPDFGKSVFSDLDTSVYAGSVLQAKMERIYEQLPLAESSMILPRVLSDTADKKPVKNQYIWPLSYEEGTLISAGWYGARTYGDRSEFWWLRTQGDTEQNIVAGSYKIVFEKGSNVAQSYFVRPAMTIDTSQVLFVSAAVGGKQFEAGSSMMKYVSDTSLKMTVIDDDMSPKFEADVVVGAAEEVTVTYRNVQLPEDTKEYTLSALLRTQEGTVSYYGKLKELGETEEEGTAVLTLPQQAADTDELLLFVEQHNGDNSTDFASTPVTVEVAKLTDKELRGTVVSGTSDATEEGSGQNDENVLLVVTVIAVIAVVIVGRIILRKRVSSD